MVLKWEYLGNILLMAGFPPNPSLTFDILDITQVGGPTRGHIPQDVTAAGLVGFDPHELRPFVGGRIAPTVRSRALN